MTDIENEEGIPFQATRNADEQRCNRPELVVYEVDGTKFEVTPRYEVQKALGKGGYGLVVQAFDRVSKKKVAIKKICNIFEKKPVIQKRVLREIKILRHFQNHENIISLIDIIPPRSYEQFNDVYIVMEFMETDLRAIIGSKQELSDDNVKYFLYQILRGLKYMHSAQVLHRDIKPENILINSNMDVKICDFGLSRGVDFENNPHMTQYVATRWYRAPELLLNWGRATKEVDMWSVGCILAELIQKRRRRKTFPLFPGRSYQHQVQLIVKALGNPKPEEIRACDAAKRFVMKLPPSQKTDFKVKFADANQLAVDLLERMLTFDPLQRISVEDALAHPYLAELHDIDDEPTAELFDFAFEHEDMDSDTIKKLLYNEIMDFNRKANNLDGDSILLNNGEILQAKDSV